MFINHCISSSEYATTMHPILTTERQLSSSFDFVPVNIIREDTKDSWTPYANKNFDDSDVSLIPAGSNTRTQVNLKYFLFYLFINMDQK